MDLCASPIPHVTCSADNHDIHHGAPNSPMSPPGHRPASDNSSTADCSNRLSVKVLLQLMRRKINSVCQAIQQHSSSSKGDNGVQVSRQV